MKHNDKQIGKLPDSELDVMLVLWSYDRPVRIAEIFNDLKTVRPCTKSAIHAMVEHLLEKGFLEIEFSEDRQSHKLISPLITKEAYRAAAAGSFLQKLCGGKWQNLIASLIDADTLSEDDIDELTTLLKRKDGFK